MYIYTKDEQTMRNELYQGDSVCRLTIHGSSKQELAFPNVVVFSFFFFFVSLDELHVPTPQD